MAPNGRRVPRPRYLSADLDGLDAKIAEAQELDAGIKTKDLEAESLGAQIAALSGAAETLHEASDRAGACGILLGDVGLDAFAAELKALGTDATAELRKRRQQLSREAEAARNIAGCAANDRTLADERTRQSQSVLDAAVKARDAALTTFSEGVDAALVSARAALAADVRSRTLATVTSAVPLDEGQQARLAAVLTRQLGRTVQLLVEVDPAVVGGVVVHVGDEVIDGSTVHRLSEARRNFTR